MRPTIAILCLALGACVDLDIRNVAPRPTVVLPPSSRALALVVSPRIRDTTAETGIGPLYGFRRALDNGFRATFARFYRLGVGGDLTLVLDEAWGEWDWSGRAGSALILHYAAHLEDAQ